MTKEALITKAIDTLSQLPVDKLQEVNNFADFILKRHEDEVLREGINSLVSESKSFAFLKEEDDLYSLEDLKEIY